MFLLAECRNPDGPRDNAASGNLLAGVFDTPEECSAACTANADCEIWVYFSDTYVIAGQRKQCFLRWDLGFSYVIPGVITGPKGCP